MSDSWGNLKRSNQIVQTLGNRSEPLSFTNSVLPVGMRRSYGDVCTNNGGSVIDATGLSKFISFDREKGLFRCEAGVTLWEVLKVIVPHGWFLPVTPGTSAITVGGAVANDVHGKNHHVAGSFGCFVRSFELRRSDGSSLICDHNKNTELFKATIAGLGLTGLIVWVEFSLMRIVNPALNVEALEYGNYSEFLQLSEQTEATHAYHVSWVDCLASGNSTGCGVFYRANHLTEPGKLDRTLVRTGRRVPAVLGKTWPLVNSFSVKTFNRLYKSRNRGRKRYVESFEKFFYPLDSLLDWNRIYGRRGFYQFQCVIPFAESEAVVDLLKIISRAGQGSFLSVLKTMGSIPSPGMMAFSRPGVTLALDFPNRGITLNLLKELEAIVVAADGAIYPAKDAMMSRRAFERGFPAYSRFASYIDSSFSSDFWRRVTS